MTEDHPVPELHPALCFLQKYQELDLLKDISIVENIKNTLSTKNNKSKINGKKHEKKGKIS